MNVGEFIVEILPGILTCIPLVVALIKFIKQSIETKNWQKIVQFVLEHMVVAEKKFSEGADRKDYVMAAVITSADTIGYPLTETDIQKISDMIDDICSASKILNVNDKTADPAVDAE